MAADNVMYGIMHPEKRSSGSVYGIMIENNRKEHDHEIREFPNSDIDWSKTHENVYLVKCDNWRKEISRQLKEHDVKARKNSVVMVDIVFSASKKFFEGKSHEEINKYFEDCLEFAKSTYGIVFNAVIHYDEATPHMHVAAVPLIQKEDGWHLSAKEIFGDKKNMRLNQTRFYEQVSKQYGLARGEDARLSKKNHLANSEYKTAKEEERHEELLQKNEKLNLEQNELLSKIDESHSELKKSNQDLRQIQELQTNATADYANLEFQIDILKNNEKSLKFKNSNLENDNKKLKSELEDTQTQLTEAKKSLKGKQVLKEQAVDHYQFFNNLTDKTKQELSEVQTQLKSAKDELAQTEETIQMHKKQISSFNQIKDRLSRVKNQCRDLLEQVALSTFGDKLNILVYQLLNDDSTYAVTNTNADKLIQQHDDIKDTGELFYDALYFADKGNWQTLYDAEKDLNADELQNEVNKIYDEMTL